MARNRVYRAIFKPTSTDRYTLDIVDIREDPDGREHVSYVLTRNGKKLFEGTDFSCPARSVSSDKTHRTRIIRGLMSFLTLRPGDTDSDYFRDYTPEQLAYCADGAEYLAIEVNAMFGED